MKAGELPFQIGFVDWGSHFAPNQVTMGEQHYELFSPYSEPNFSPWENPPKRDTNKASISQFASKVTGLVTAEMGVQS